MALYDRVSRFGSLRHKKIFGVEEPKKNRKFNICIILYVYYQLSTIINLMTLVLG